MNDRLYRSRDNRVIAGVAGGVAEMLDLDPSLVRVLWVVLALVSGGLLGVVYVVMMFVVPEEPVGSADWRGWRGAPATDAAAGPMAPTAAGAAPGDAGAMPFAAGDRPTEAIPPSADDAGPSAPPAGPSAPPPAPTATPIPGGPGPWQPGAQGWREARRAEREARRAERRSDRAYRRARRGPGSGAIVFGLILIVLGGYLLARRYLPAVDADRLWPAAIVVLGVLLILGSIRPGGREAG